MTTIELAAPWTYRTPEKTINYPAGTHEVFQYVADQAEAEGVIATAAIGSPDPLDGSIEELAVYIATVTDPQEIATLRRNEQNGKTRKGALDVLMDRWNELTEGDDGDTN